MQLAGLRDFFHCGAFSEDGATRAEIAKLATTHAHVNKNTPLPIAESPLSVITATILKPPKANGILSVAVASGPMPAAELRSYAPDIFVESLADLDINVFFT